MDIKKLENLNADFTKRWGSFVQNHPNGNFFQAPAAYQFFSGVEGYTPFMIYAEEENNIKGILSAVIIKESGAKAYFSRRCIVWGGPLYYDIDTAEKLIKKLDNEISSKTIYTEFRNLFDVNELKDLFLKNGYVSEDRINYIVEIESSETNKKKLNENRKRQINKSIKTGCRIIPAENIEQVKDFYTILLELYKSKVKKPIPSFDFFQKFFENSYLGKYLLIEYQGKIIGGIMTPVYKDTIYEWYVCGLDNEFKDQSPSVMATWAAIEYGINNGLKCFDFMGAGKPNEDYGVREFKSKFGGKEVRYGRYVRINNKLMYNIGELGLKLLGAVKR